MRTYWLGIARGFSLPAVLLLLAACGGGGGGSSNGVVYAGNSSPATVTTANASKLTANVVGNNDTAAIIIGFSTESGDATQELGSGAMDIALRLNRSFRETVVRAEQARSSQRAVTAAIPVNETDLCAGGGSTHASGTLSDSGTGTLMISFNSCVIDGVTLNGSGTLRVDAVDPIYFIPTDFTMSFARLKVRGSGLSVDAGGSLRAQLDLGTNAETITSNLVSLNNNTGETTKTENLVIVSAPTSLTSFVANISGRVFDQVNGYVDIATTVSFVFDTVSRLFPVSGQILLTGALPTGPGNSSIRVTALSVPPAALPATLARLELDLNADNIVDNTATLKWTDLSGPVGSDLADNDGDGMHNSWETANGLNPDVNDAAGNPDFDAFTNLQEYQAGTDPSDINSHP